MERHGAQWSSGAPPSALSGEYYMPYMTGQMPPQPQFYTLQQQQQQQQFVASGVGSPAFVYPSPSGGGPGHRAVSNIVQPHPYYAAHGGNAIAIGGAVAGSYFAPAASTGDSVATFAVPQGVVAQSTGASQPPPPPPPLPPAPPLPPPSDRHAVPAAAPVSQASNEQMQAAMYAQWQQWQQHQQQQWQQHQQQQWQQQQAVAAGYGVQVAMPSPATRAAVSVPGSVPVGPGFFQPVEGTYASTVPGVPAQPQVESKGRGLPSWMREQLAKLRSQDDDAAGAGAGKASSGEDADDSKGGQRDDVSDEDEAREPSGELESLRPEMLPELRRLMGLLLRSVTDEILNDRTEQVYSSFLHEGENRSPAASSSASRVDIAATVVTKQSGSEALLGLGEYGLDDEAAGNAAVKRPSSPAVPEEDTARSGKAGRGSGRGKLSKKERVRSWLVHDSLPDPPANHFEVQILKGSQLASTVPIVRADLLLGRDAGADVRSDHMTVSRQHALLRFRDGDSAERGIYLVDLGSGNGSFVLRAASRRGRGSVDRSVESVDAEERAKEERAEAFVPIRLRDGDVFRLGDSSRQYVLRAHGEPSLKRDAANSAGRVTDDDAVKKGLMSELAALGDDDEVTGEALDESLTAKRRRHNGDRDVLRESKRTRSRER